MAEEQSTPKQHHKSHVAGLWKWMLALLLPLAVAMWATDWVTLQDEYTIYTGSCTGGEWMQGKCTGELRAGNRYRFRALRAHEEVLFWVAGSRERSGRLDKCVIKNKRNWKCPPGADSERSITLEMKNGHAVAGAPGTRPFRPISKVAWFYLRFKHGEPPPNDQSSVIFAPRVTFAQRASSERM
jgi:hypothetical protein